MADAEDSKLYLIFISIIFAMLLSVWIVPVGMLFEKAGSEPEDVFNALFSGENIQGIVMFGILICLWWWYAIFIGKLNPAVSFIMFSYDFISLGTFSIAFRLWLHPIVFPFTILIAALFMLGRFWYTKKTLQSDDRPDDCSAMRAINSALIVLLTIIVSSLFSLFVFVQSAFSLEDQRAAEPLFAHAWIVARYSVTLFLIAGIGVTIHAAKITECFGWLKVDSWAEPAPVEQWLENASRRNGVSHD